MNSTEYLAALDDGAGHDSLTIKLSQTQDSLSRMHVKARIRLCQSPDRAAGASPRGKISVPPSFVTVHG